MQSVFVGLDLGTSGLRVVGLAETGIRVASVAQTWEGVETDPNRWVAALRTLLPNFKAQLQPDHCVQALSICSTSGSILALDQQGAPLTTAWLYNDPRGQEQAKRLGISSSWGLGRWLWWKETDPQRYEQSVLAHPTDFMLQQLGAERGITDHTCALKSGFDLMSYRWPAEWLYEFELTTDPLPRVVAPGTPIGTVSIEWGLGSGVQLIAGCTDGCAGQLAAGAVSINQLSTSLGTTLIFKAVSSEQIQTQDGSVYSHLHPDRQSWLPGAASFCGGGALNHFYPGINFAEWDQRAWAEVPTATFSYPLWSKGERFPLTDPDFKGSLPQADPGSVTFYAGLMEGIAMVERLGLERLDALGVNRSEAVYTTGGSSRSEIWLQIRASVLNRPLILTQYPQPVVGAAIIAAAGWWQCPVEEAVKALARIHRQVDPVNDWVERYEQNYSNLKAQFSLMQ